MAPLFPRLHVNDADKGGPRAPPRNKMALYEQLSIPSQRFHSGAAPSLPLPPQRASSLVPSSASSQGCGHERRVFSPFYVPAHVTAHSTEKVSNHSTEGLNPNGMRMGLEKKSQKHVSQRMVNTVGTEHPGVECSSLRSHGFSSARESSRKLEGEDDFRVPTFVLHGTAQHSEKEHHCMPGTAQHSEKEHHLMPGTAQHSEKEHHRMKTEMRTRLHSDSLQKNGKTTLKCPIRVQNSDGKSLERQGTTFLMSHSRQHERGTIGGKAKEVATHIKSTENMPHLASREKATRPSNLSKPSSNQECHCGKSNELGPSHSGTASLHREPSGTFGGPRHLNDVGITEKQDMSNGRTGSYSRMPLGNGFRGPYVAENGNASYEDNVATIAEDLDRNGSSGGAYKISPSEDAAKHHSSDDPDGNDDASDTSMVDSISGVGITPDDVAGVIGMKHFWKARRAIINQQRVFALQVFELHRLIRVQKLIAASPHSLLEDDSYLHVSPPKAPMKDLPAKSLVKPQQHIDTEDESCKVNRNSEFSEENMPAIPSLRREDSNSKGPGVLLQRNGSCSNNLASAPVASDNKPGSWPFNIPGNQWLIPVMSPTEGLVYKPYAGPCPPNGAFMAPFYGGCGALSVPPGAGDFISPAYGIPTTPKQENMGVLPRAPAVAPNFFPASFDLPVANPLISCSAVEQVSSLAGPWSSGRKEQQSQNSCSMSKPRSEALSECARKVQSARDIDIHGSTASSPDGRVQQGRDARLLFPMASAKECPGKSPQSHHRDHHSRVIKVVPHNPRTATESAARIFQSIQKERQQYDFV